MTVSFRQHAYNHLSKKMFTGDLPLGSRLSEEAIAKEIGISRTPVREALNQLVSEGLAEQIPHYGVFVRSLNRTELEEIYDLREMLECYAVATAAEQNDSKRVKAMRANCEALHVIARDFAASGDSDLQGDLAWRQVANDVQFHALVLEAAQRPQTHRMVKNLHLFTQTLGTKRFVPGRNILRLIAKTWREHCAIVQAIDRQDPTAARAWMSRHLQRGKAQGLQGYDYRQSHGAADEAADWPRELRRIVPEIENQDVI